MAYFQFGEKQLKLGPGAQKLGPDGTGADISLPGVDATATAIVVLNPDQTAVIRKADEHSVVLVNKVPLGVEPLPLMHGDHVELGGHDLRFGDTANAGSTQFVSAADLAEIARARADLPKRPTLATGGRLISLVDGREYLVGERGVVIGRDPASDIVIANTQISRRHVQILPGEAGYTLTDLSTNGVWVNEQRVAGQRVLGKGDVIRLGDEEFRFYADARESAATPVTAESLGVTPVASTPIASTPVASTPIASTPIASTPIASTPIASTPVASTPVASTPEPAQPAAAAPVAAQPAAAEPAAAAPSPALATLIVSGEGPDSGRHFDVFGPLTNIGRGAHNDFVLASESVSDSHAKLQKRDAGWFLVDVNSTNGTFVGGRRIAGEHQLRGAPDLRFGDVLVLFKPGMDHADEGKGTRVIPLNAAEEARRIAAARRAVDQTPKSASAQPIAIPEPPAEEPATDGSPLRIWMLVLALLTAIVAYFIIGRTL